MKIRKYCQHLICLALVGPLLGYAQQDANSNASKLAIIKEGVKQGEAKFQSAYGLISRDQFYVRWPDPEMAKNLESRLLQHHKSQAVAEDPEEWKVQERELQERLGEHSKGATWGTRRLITFWFDHGKYQWGSYFISIGVNRENRPIGWFTPHSRRLINEGGWWLFEGSLSRVAQQGRNDFGPWGDDVWWLKYPLGESVLTQPPEKYTFSSEKLDGKWDCIVFSRVLDATGDSTIKTWICPALDYLPLRHEGWFKGKKDFESIYTPKKYGNVWFYEVLDDISYYTDEKAKPDFYKGDIRRRNRVTVLQLTLNQPVDPSVFKPEAIMGTDNKVTSYIDMRSETPVIRTLGED